jgi:hypothetical protein
VQDELVKRASVVQAREKANPSPFDDSDAFTFSDASEAWQPEADDIKAASDQIGGDHNPFAAPYLRNQLGAEEGTVTVTKGSGAFDKGALDVRGILAYEDKVKECLEAVSKRPINFLSD